jgi:nicotinamidase/pyrazinamidase
MKIFYDVDTQYDFMDAGGKLHVPDAELLLPILNTLTEHAVTKGYPIFGSVDLHYGSPARKNREGELKRWGGPFPDHCMVGTKGQEKIPQTVRPALGIKFVPNFEPSMTYTDQEIRGLFTPCRMVMFEKQSYDVTANPLFARVMKVMNVTQVVVYGVATDYCVKAAVLAMRKLGIQTFVVEDAIKGVAPDTTAAALDEMKKAGAEFLTAAQIMSPDFNRL